VTGHAKIMAWFDSMIANLALSDFTILDLFVDGNKAAVRWRASVRHAETKDESTTEIAQFRGSRAWPSDLLGRVP
jgi:hypothetical protein